MPFFIIKPYNFNKGQEISEELREAKEKFKLELDKKANEYYILGIKDDYQKTKVVTIPESIDGILVTKLLDEEESFSSYRYISELVISKNVKYIGNNAFELCTSLPEVDISNVEEMGNYVFSKTGVKTIILSENTKLICNGAFDYCSNLTELTFNYNGMVEIELNTLSLQEKDINNIRANNFSSYNNSNNNSTIYYTRIFN